MIIKPVLTVPVGQVANAKFVDMIAMRNVEIEQSNLTAASEWQRHLRDTRNQEAAHLAQAMRQGAPIELLALEATHKYVAGSCLAGGLSPLAHWLRCDDTRLTGSDVGNATAPTDACPSSTVVCQYGAAASALPLCCVTCHSHANTAKV